MRSQVVSQEKESMLLLAEQYGRQHRDQQSVHHQAEMHRALHNSMIVSHASVLESVCRD